MPRRCPRFFDVQPSVAVCCAVEFCRRRAWSEAVFLAILDDGLQKPLGTKVKRFFIDVFDDVQIIAPEAGLRCRDSRRKPFSTTNDVSACAAPGAKYC
jgi:hypothetical protein